jgi:hypothetical protein
MPPPTAFTIPTSVAARAESREHRREVAPIDEERRRPLLEEEPVPEERAAEAGDEREHADPHHVVALADRRQAPGDREEEDRREVEGEREVERAGEERAHARLT